MTAEELQARLNKLDEEVGQAREAYVNNDNPTKDAKLKEVWEKTLAQRGTMLDSIFAPELRQGKEFEEFLAARKRGLDQLALEEHEPKKVKKEGLKMKDESSTKHMPYMKSVESIPQLWSLWEHGAPEHGITAISLLSDRTRREKGFNRQRFHEWSTVASEIQQQAYQGGILPPDRAAQLEEDRKHMKASMPQYAKILMSQFKDRRARFQAIQPGPQERYQAPLALAPPLGAPPEQQAPAMPGEMDEKTMNHLAETTEQQDIHGEPQQQLQWPNIE